MRLVLCVLLAALSLSCTAEQSSSGHSNEVLSIQDIVNQWAIIDRLLAAAENTPDQIEASPLLKETSDSFYLSLMKFQVSDLYRIYRSIPFSPQIRRSFILYPPRDIQEVTVITDLALVFRDSVASGDMEKARAASAEISRYLIRLLVIDGEAQRYIGSSYFHLLIALIFFIVIIAILIRFLHQSLTRSLKRETDTIIFSHSYMLAQDEERGRISRELHDTIIQDMRYLLLETDNPMMADLIRKTRNICNNLIPPDFRFSELPDALKQLCLDFGGKTGIDCRAETDGNIKLEFLTMEKKLQVYRIVQEAFTNIEKHAEAKEAIVTMRSDNGIIYIGIGDDGKGFKSPIDVSGQIIAGIEKSHIGIISMKERTAILGGRLKIESEFGEGTLVCLEIPVKEESNGSVAD